MDFMNKRGLLVSFDNMFFAKGVRLGMLPAGSCMFMVTLVAVSSALRTLSYPYA
jgi:hypothetical protein